jgi:farnesyl-diphosphate farnesyltransferase
MTRSSFETDLAWCYDAVQGVSRTFAITIAELDEPLSREICVGYLLCRVADTVEDSRRIPADEQVRLLRLYRSALDPSDPTDVQAFREAVDRWIPADPGDDWRVVADAPRVVRTYRGLDDTSREQIRPPVRELVDGMAVFVERYADAGGLRLRTVDELEEYCWYAAGTVGTLVTGLVSREASPDTVATLEDNARAFALLLQLVNVAKDVGVDCEEENNVYLPRNWLDDAGLAPEDLADPGHADAAAGVVRRLTDHAAGYLDGAQTWLAAMPETRGNTLSAWGIPFLLAAGTIRELRRRPADPVARGGVKVSREEVRAVVGAFDGGNPDLGLLRERILQAPLHETE